MLFGSSHDTSIHAIAVIVVAGGATAIGSSDNYATAR